MKRFARSSSGVTLLEIMLVLAIAANILVMSIRFYQTASANQQANAALEMILGITAAADSLKEATGSYLQANVNTDSIQSLMPNNSMTSPWNSPITVPPSDVADNVFEIVFTKVPTAVCVILKSHLSVNKKYVVDVASRCGSGNFFGVLYYSGDVR